MKRLPAKQFDRMKNMVVYWRLLYSWLTALLRVCFPHMRLFEEDCIWNFPGNLIVRIDIGFWFWFTVVGFFVIAIPDCVCILHQDHSLKNDSSQYRIGWLLKIVVSGQSFWRGFLPSDLLKFWIFKLNKRSGKHSYCNTPGSLKTKLAKTAKYRSDSTRLEFPSPILRFKYDVK